MHLSSCTVHIFKNYEMFIFISIFDLHFGQFFMIIFVTFVFSLCLWLLKPTYIYIFFEIKEICRIKQKLRNSNHDNWTCYWWYWRCDVKKKSILCQCELKSSHPLFFMLVSFSLYIPHRNITSSCIASHFLWCQNHHKLYFHLKGNIFHEAGTFLSPKTNMRS